MNRREALSAFFALPAAIVRKPQPESIAVHIDASGALFDQRGLDNLAARIRPSFYGCIMGGIGWTPKHCLRCSVELKPHEVAAAELPPKGTHARTFHCDSCWSKSVAHWNGPSGEPGPPGME